MQLPIWGIHVRSWHASEEVSESLRGIPECDTGGGCPSRLLRATGANLPNLALWQVQQWSGMDSIRGDGLTAE
jgi:hypothetical protein